MKSSKSDKNSLQIIQTRTKYVYIEKYILLIELLENTNYYYN